MKTQKLSSIKSPDGIKFRFKNSIVIWAIQKKVKGGFECTASLSQKTRVWKFNKEVIKLTDTHL